MNPNDGDLYGGLSDATFEVNRFDLDGGITISTTSAHLTCQFYLGSGLPSQDQEHPALWRLARGSFGIDLSAEIFVPREFNWPNWFDRANTIRWIAGLLRLRATPRLRVPIISNLSFSQTAPTTGEVGLWPVDQHSQRDYAVLDLNAGYQVSLKHLKWIQQHWVNAGHLMQGRSSAFKLIMAAFDNCSWVLDAELSLFQLWSALEALFSPGRNELRFRVSANVATFLEPPGRERHCLQKKVAKLYDARSAAIHGSANNVEEALVETYAVTRRVLIKIIEQNHVPSVAELESKLFGAS